MVEVQMQGNDQDETEETRQTVSELETPVRAFNEFYQKAEKLF